MRLDRNTNPDKGGKYALVNLRKLRQLIGNSHDTLMAFKFLQSAGVITLGNESPGDQFFVMKYKDKFTASGLRGYATAIVEVLRLMPAGPEKTSLSEFAGEIFYEAHSAEKLGNRLPD